MIVELSRLLAFERHPGTQELAERAGLALYPCPLPALLTEIGCNANRARFRAAQKARDTLTQRVFEECRGCPGVVGLARGRKRRASRQIDHVLTAGQAAGMVGWPDVGTAPRGSMPPAWSRLSACEGIPPSAARAGTYMRGRTSSG